MEVVEKTLQQVLKDRLKSFDADERRRALIELVRIGKSIHKSSENVNMHLHSFFSYNAENWSPTRIAWECAQKGLYAAGIVDFDVLDGQEEFIQVGELLGLRTSVGLETRAFLTEYLDKVIDSPGEPGVSYILAGGFVKELANDSPQAKTLASYKETSTNRNLALIDRINPHVPDIAIDYSIDVLPLTPSGNATERHIISAYVSKAQQAFPDAQVLKNFWAELLNKTANEMDDLLKNRAALEELVRAKFAKRGGFGYVQPTSETFPKVEEFFQWAQQCGAIPMESWLDGTSEGESDGKALLECSKAKGACALNLIPDRNWNISNPETKAMKMANLKDIINIANSMDMPIHIGTEMNKAGLPFVDDLNGAALKPFKETIIKGASIFIGHAVLARYADFFYAGQKAQEMFGSSVKNKNDFFSAVGVLPPLSSNTAYKLKEYGEEKAFTEINDALKKGKWSK
ncbi:MAG: hypothetical protein ACFCUU_17460 [Cyclobacteriaceae bacterium]